MASKGPRSRLDHETRAKRQKALEPPKEPQRPRTHWDHLLEEMVWLSKDFESERKFKLGLAKRIAIRASKGMVDQATRGERRVKEEELRMKKVALNISKDVKKFWTKIEKLVLYKHRLELDQKKKKALDKQLEFLLGQTERYSTMLAENLVDSSPRQHVQLSSVQEQRPAIEYKDQSDVNGCAEPNVESQSNILETDEDYKAENEPEDDEHTLEEDEALITEDERREELTALQNEMDLPLEELLRRYTVNEESTPGKTEGEAELAHAPEDNLLCNGNDNSDLGLKESRHCAESNGGLSVLENHHPEVKEHYVRKRKGLKKQKKYLELDFNDENEDVDFVLANGEEKDDETTLLEEEELAKTENHDSVDELAMLQKDSEIPIEELLARYRQDPDTIQSDENDSGSEIEIPDQEEKPDQIADDGGENDDIIADAAAAARSAQPTGNTFLTTKVRTKYPFLLKFSLREYQHIGLDWLVTMYEKRLNGILADEMGLGKTIMTIALLAHLACEKGIWGPHLIVVPTSVMLNWETEFLKWCPAFKILTYFGSAKERKHKRQGWLKPNSFHVCITTYRLVIQDSKIFKRKKWRYLILDEAHLIKNWKSQRWQTLLNFNTKRRILLTGTPLQNDLMELWSLMHFLMPHIFQSHQEFKDWFSNPITGMVEGQEKVNKEVVDRLHNVLRPFILRRLKRDVEKQLPSKHEHVIYCRLSRRQRNLYEDFIASSETQATLQSSNFFGMISVIMQLRKVCNHPDLFEGRPIISSFDMNGIETQFCSSICSVLESGPFSTVDLTGLGFVFTHLDFDMTSWETEEVESIATPSELIKSRVVEESMSRLEIKTGSTRSTGFNIFEEIQKALMEERLKEMKARAESVAWWNSLRARRKPMYSTGLREIVSVENSISTLSGLHDIVFSPVDRFNQMVDQVESFMFAIPAARAPPPVGWCSKPGTTVFVNQDYKTKCLTLLSPLLTPIRPAIVRRQVYFPDRRLIQFDCGKLQELAVLLRRLKSEGHRALIFTQMTKMLDVLEAFINIYGYTYMRLDGSTQPEERQTLMQRFNTNPKYFLFILSTRSGGVGINLVGADTVIFYDSDWNPAMDQQAQDRCHRIGQTREVHIYRLISESTIEENILKKAKQKRALDDLVIQSGEYNTEFFKKLDPLELFSGHGKNSGSGVAIPVPVPVPVSNADVEAALKHAEDEADYMALKKVEQEEAVDNQEFTEEAIGKLEDDELLNEEDGKFEELGTGQVEGNNREMVICSDPNGDPGLTLVKGDDGDDDDMADDVKQMAVAAAASGQEILSFENQLRPIDRYAVRFLEMWDPIVDNVVIESKDRFEGEEWELDHIEKLKEDMEAEGDDDEEPLVYETWDTEFATKVYQEQVKALAEHQLMEEREMEAREKELEESDSLKNEPVVKKPKSKKKTKKTKFKSLKKEALSSETKPINIESPIEFDDDYVDDEIIFLKKRKKPLDESTSEVKSSSRKSKKPKKNPEPISLDMDSNSLIEQQDEPRDLKPFVNNNLEIDHKPVIRGKSGLKISVTTMPVKRVMTIRLEKLKKGSIWPNDCVPTPDSWLSSEDAMLCAVVHEYGVNWSLASEILNGMTAGGFYRGILRHPVHCCERYRELVQRHVLSSSDNNVHNDKASNVGVGKALLRVTEEHAKSLLDIVSERPDQAYTLQKHFFHLLTSVWRSTARSGHRKTPLSLRTGQRVNHTSRDPVRPQSERMEFTNLKQISRLVSDALESSQNIPREDRVSSFSERREVRPVGQLGITLEFPPGRDDPSVPLPSVVSLSINDTEPVLPEHLPVGGNHCFRSSKDTVECRFRDAASRAAIDGGLGLPPSASPATDVKSRTPAKSQLSGKHHRNPELPLKSSKSKSRKAIMDSNEAFSLLRDPNLQPSMPPINLCSRFDTDMESSMDDFLNASSIDLGNELSFDIVPHDYDPGFTWGLEDCLLSREFTDIG